MTRRLGLLGPGHVGRWILRTWLKSSVEARAFVLSRGQWSSSDLGDLASRLRMQEFELGSSWESDPRFQDFRSALTDCDVVIATFPLCGSGPSQRDDFSSPDADEFMMGIVRLFEFLRSRGIRVATLSSSSGYYRQNGVISEDDAWREGHQRFGFEEWLRKNLGVAQLVLPGLFGDGREPKEWLKKGMVRNWEGSVNLLHHEDAGYLVSQVLTETCDGERINISSSELHFWPVIAMECGVFPPGVESAEAEALAMKIQLGGIPEQGKILSNAKLMRLCPQLQNFNFRRYP